MLNANKRHPVQTAALAKSPASCDTDRAAADAENREMQTEDCLPRIPPALSGAIRS